MGRYNLRPLRVHQAATQLFETKRINNLPPWYDVIGTIPPAETLVRPVQRTRVPRSSRKPSKMFQPVRLSYPEDKLRQEFFGDHPWELARPRVILENDGKDGQKRDWSSIQQLGKKLDGESVVQRQMWLMKHKSLSKQAAYDQARKEFYRHRHLEDLERRVAKEEALSTGAYFGKSALEVGMDLENAAFENWKQWAVKEIEIAKQAQAAAYTGPVNEDAVVEDAGESSTAEVAQS